MILWEKSDCSPDWTELLSILADLAKLTEKCSKNCGLLPYIMKLMLEGGDRESDGCVAGAQLIETKIFQILHYEADIGGR